MMAESLTITQNRPQQPRCLQVLGSSLLPEHNLLVRRLLQKWPSLLLPGQHQSSSSARLPARNVDRRQKAPSTSPCLYNSTATSDSTCWLARDPDSCWKAAAVEPLKAPLSCRPSRAADLKDMLQQAQAVRTRALRQASSAQIRCSRDPFKTSDTYGAELRHSCQISRGGGGDGHNVRARC